MHRKTNTANALSVSLTFSILVALSVVGCRSESGRDANSGSPHELIKNVLFITLDTTRADYIGCYGRKEAQTPTIDALAARGTRFARAYSQVPLTLPSHASMMTGKYPREFGVRDNGRGAIDSTHITLAELAKEAGFRTGAFVAAFVLESRYGLSQGFDEYDDNFEIMSSDVKMMDMERRGDVIAEHAIHWLESDTAKPFFCWVHFYDAHHPYAPPAEYASKFADQYDAEIAFADTQLARVLDSIKRTNRLDNTLIIVVGDHGESFGEHGEKGHSVFLYDSNLHVPLIAAGPGVKTRGIIQSPVEIVDLFKAVCELLHWKAPEGLISDSLAPALAGEELEADLCYSESHFAYNAYRWAEQRSITSDRWKYVSSALPELYDLTQDHGETKNLISQNPDKAKELADFLAQRYSEMKPIAAAAVVQDASARQAIESLGYVGGSRDEDTEVLTPNLLDPKTQYPLIEVLATANKLITAGKCQEAKALLEEPARRSPDSVRILTLLATTHIGLQRPDQALPLLKHALEIDPEYPDALEIMGDALFNMQRYDEAARHFAAEIAVVPGDAKALYKLGLSHRRLNRLDDAIVAFRKSLDAFPGNMEAGAAVLDVLYAAGRADSAPAIFEELVRRHPANAEARLNLGICMLSAGRFNDAATALGEAIRLNPKLGPAYNKLGICFAKTGKPDEANKMFLAALSMETGRAEAYYNLGVTAEKNGNLEDAFKFYQNSIAADPANADVIVTAARILLRQGRNAELVALLKAGSNSCPSNLAILNTLAETLATCPDNTVRNGLLAVEYSERACRLTNYRHAGLLSTLAASYAEAGRFEKAVEITENAIALAKSGNQADFMQDLQRQLQLYKEQKPIRKP